MQGIGGTEASLRELREKTALVEELRPYKGSGYKPGNPPSLM